MKSEKNRIFVFSIFLVVLILFAIVYRPTSALSDPTNRPGAVVPAVTR